MVNVGGHSGPAEPLTPVAATMLSHAAIDRATGNGPADCTGRNTEDASADDLGANHCTRHAASHQAGRTGGLPAIFSRVMRVTLVMMCVIIGRRMGISRGHNGNSRGRQHRAGNRHVQNLAHILRSSVSSLKRASPRMYPNATR